MISLKLKMRKSPESRRRRNHDESLTAVF